MVWIHSRRDRPSVAQIVVLRREETPPPQNQRHVRGVREARKHRQGQTPAPQQGQAPPALGHAAVRQRHQHSLLGSTSLMVALRTPRLPSHPLLPHVSGLAAVQEQPGGNNRNPGSFAGWQGGPKATSCCKPWTWWHFEARLFLQRTQAVLQHPCPEVPSKGPPPTLCTLRADGHLPLEN